MTRWEPEIMHVCVHITALMMLIPWDEAGGRTIWNLQLVAFGSLSG